MTKDTTASNVGTLLHVKVIGKPSEEAYVSLTTDVAEHVRRHGRIRLVIEAAESATELDDPLSRAFWEYWIFQFRHWNNIERLALIGELKWALAVSVLCAPLTAAQIRHFGSTDLGMATAWANESC